ncbi:MAG: GGDEF domain-containing protein [Clostridia bacterium]|nr:MAG: GGDEF domain-containing protein [Clostridia bacterium]
MVNGEVRRLLWLAIGIASLSFAVLAWLSPVAPDPLSLALMATAVALCDGWFIPFALLANDGQRWKRIFSIGANLVLATLWVMLTGGLDSPFFPHIFFLPLVAAILFPGSTLTGSLAISGAIWAISLALIYQYGPVTGLTPTSIISELIALLVVGLVMGHLIQVERRANAEKQDLAEQLHQAYQELSENHQSLQAYTRRIEELNSQLERMAITDDLTELFNFRYFQSRLEQEIHRHEQRSLALLMLDVDWFKQVNDRFGHEEGNRVLVEFSNLLQDNVREGDIVTRYGGEEFAIILPETEKTGALQVAERIRQAVGEHEFTFTGGETMKLTASVGISVYCRDAHTRDDLVSHADQALYIAKEAGRNNIRFYPDAGYEIQPLTSDF